MRALAHLLQAARRGLASGGALLPSMGLAAGALLFVSVPGPMPSAPTPDEAVSDSDSPPPALEGDARIAKIDAVLARHSSGLGLEVRQQLASALVTESDAAHLDPMFVLAVMNVESEFDDLATSVRGARGLMQIRPTTLSFVAQREGLRLPTEEIERDPVLSARLAVRYLGRLVAAFKGNLDLALMAYNAGPHRVNTALVEGGDLSSLGGYPRAVRRSWQRLLDHPSTDDQAVAERAARVRSGE